MTKLAFTATSSRSHLRMVRDLEDLGATVGCASDREKTVYSVEVLRSNAAAALALLGEAVVAPAASDWQVAEQKASLSCQLTALQAQPQVVLTEALMQAAFGDNSPLGQSMYPSTGGLASLGAEAVAAFRQETHCGARAALSLVGADSSVLSAAQAAFGGLPSGAAAAPAADTFVGGEARVSADCASTFVALGFAASSDLASLAVLQQLLARRLGDSSAFLLPLTAGGTGVLGVYAAAASTSAGAVPAAVEAAVAALKAAAAAPAAGDEFAAAAARAATLAADDRRSALAASRAAQLLSAHAAAALDLASATPETVQRAAAAAVGGPLAMASVGDTSVVPRAAAVAAALL